MLTTKEIAWLAGLLEGEGCFELCRTKFRSGNPYNRPRITLASTDKDVVEHTAKLFGSVVSPPRRRPGRKPIYNTKCLGDKAIGWMQTLFVLLGERRRRKIKDILVEWKAMPVKNPGFRPPDIEDILDKLTKVPT